LMAFSFEVKYRDADSPARCGKLKTSRGEIDTPAFMPVGTKGAVKAVSPGELQDMGYGLILANAYHLYLRPGHDAIGKFGGLHAFMDWQGAILTDSGGFQVFSLARLRSLMDEGVLFQSHIDGSSHMFTPELAVEVQEALGAEIIMCLDDVRGYPVNREDALQAVERTTHWADRCLKAKKRIDPALFGIVQGSVFWDLRQLSAQGLTSLGFAGYALGGLSVGEPRDVMLAAIEAAAPFLPEFRPRYLMGVGKPQDILDGVLRGIDLFDCVLPTRNARNGTLFTSRGPLNIRNSRRRDESGPVDPNCGCALCANYSRAYLRHLFMEKEIYGHRLATIHNLSYYSRLMAEIRKAIETKSLRSFAREFLAMTEENDD
jgi:queuine tRNA-ribosyltransferase